MAVQVLLLEPDPSVALLMQQAMSRRAADFHIWPAGSLAAAQVALDEHPIDVALVELNLPDAQGLLTLTELRRRRPALPVVVLTTIADEDLAITAIQQGAQDYLIKESVHYALVSRSIRYAMERKRIELELHAATEAALAASKAKSEFLAHMSHEIRNPLSAVVSHADVLLNPGLTRDELHAAVESIRRNGQHLLEVVNDILDISKIEACQFEIERIECSPAEIVADAIDMFQMRARAKGLALTVHWHPGLPAAILSDPLRLKQIVVNLVSNAVKFTERGEICVAVRHHAIPGGPTLEIEVSDTGIGISPEQQQRLFLTYQQSATWTSRQFGGTGLGLAISRELARRLGGDITVTSEPGVGSTFRVRVAAEPASSRRTAALPEGALADGHPAATSPPAGLRGRILLVEDAPDNQRLIATLLRRAGATVDLASDGRQAVEAALAAMHAGQPYDLILMDMIMPEMDGFTATRQLRQAGCQQPIVALTANFHGQSREECLAAGCDEYATKPIDRARLLEVVAKWLPAPSPSPATCERS
jgi:signal transduction histidine kinase